MMPKTTCGYYTGDGVKIYVTDTTTGEKTELGGVQEFKLEKGQLYCDDNLYATQYTYNIRGGERNMDNRILDLYAERAKEKIKKEYETIVNNDYDKLDVVKEYKELVNTFTTSLAEMADRYNTEENKYLVRTGYEITPSYELSDDIRANIREKYLDEAKERLKDIDLLVEEVRAVLGVSNTEEYRISVLKEYGIIDKKGKLNV